MSKQMQRQYVDTLRVAESDIPELIKNRKAYVRINALIVATIIVSVVSAIAVL